MNPRHAAALALVGCYLMMPPVSQNHQLVENAPLSQWDKIESYDTAAACRNELAKLTALIAGNTTYSLIQRRVLAGKCVADDDPRLHSENFEAN